MLYLFRKAQKDFPMVLFVLQDWLVKDFIVKDEVFTYGISEDIMKEPYQNPITQYKETFNLEQEPEPATLHVDDDDTGVTVTVDDQDEEYVVESAFEDNDKKPPAKHTSSQQSPNTIRKKHTKSPPLRSKKKLW